MTVNHSVSDIRGFWKWSYKINNFFSKTRVN